MFAGKARSLSESGHMKGASLRWALVLLANNRQDWKGLQGTSTQAYYEHLEITAVKCFITLCPDELPGVRVFLLGPPIVP
jgi:hypothetical protein